LADVAHALEDRVVDDVHLFLRETNQTVHTIVDGSGLPIAIVVHETSWVLGESYQGVFRPCAYGKSSVFTKSIKYGQLPRAFRAIHKKGKGKGEEMPCHSFEQIIESMQLCLAGDPESKWILESLMRRAIVFAQQEPKGIALVRMPEPPPDRTIHVIILRAEAQSVRDGNPLVFNDDLPGEGEEMLPVLVFAQRKCDPFWFGLKASVETLIYERAHDCDETGNPEHVLARHVQDTTDMHDRLIYRALDRRFEGALERLIKKVRARAATVVVRDILVLEVIRILYSITQRTFPDASSLEEMAVRDLLIADAAKYVVAQALRPVPTIN
jgi:hypothetical protein